MAQGTGAGLVVVGVDGSAGSQAALQWAARRACDRGMPLSLLAAPSARVPSLVGVRGQGTAEDARELRLRSARDWVRESFPGVEVSADLVDAGAGVSLVAASSSAQLLVMGSTGGRCGRAGLDDVADAVVTQARCPVAVVPPSVTGPARGPVIVAIEDVGTSGPVVAVAVAEALSAGELLVAVHRWEADAMRPSRFRRSAALRARGCTARLVRERMLDGLLQPYRAQHPGLLAETVVVEQSIRGALTGVSANARLLVVGPRERDVARSASCPTIIVPTSTDVRAGG